MHVPEKHEMLAIPLIHPFTLFEKKKVVSIKVGKAYKNVFPHSYSYFVYLPEIAQGLALDITSDTLNRNLFKYFSHFDGMRYSIFDRTAPLLSLKAYNYDNSQNRIVSWGNYRIMDIPRKEYIHFFNVFYEDLLMMPSLISQGTLISPTRWANFTIITMTFSLSFDFHLNSGIIYIDEIKAKEIENQLVDEILYELPITFVKVFHTGYINVYKTKIHLRTHPEKIFECYELPGYFNAVIMSFLNIEYSGKSVPPVNLVDESMITPLNSVDIVRALSYFFVKDPRSPLLEISIPRSVFDRVAKIFSSRALTPFSAEFLNCDPFGICGEVSVKKTEIIMKLVNPTHYFILLKENPSLVSELGDELYQALIDLSIKNPLYKEFISIFGKNSALTYAKKKIVNYYLNLTQTELQKKYGTYKYSKT